MKKSLLMTAAAMAAFGAMAAPLSPQAALQRATSSANGRKLVKTSATPVLAYTGRDVRGEAALYVFNQPNSEGFILLSGDDVAVPMLGYTDSGKFDPNNIPPQLQYWLDEYTHQIEYAKEQGVQATESNDISLTFPSSWNSITPYIDANWDQREPYNNECPKYKGELPPAGCVAIATGMVMNYWKYPSQATGSITYDSEGIGKLTLDFSKSPAIDWDNILPNYVEGQYTEAQGKAVSNLIKQVAYGVQMKFNPAGSGTQTEYVAIAMTKYFGYNPNMNIASRTPYGASEWNELIYSELKYGPVIYAGQSDLGGHCFVLDGYDGNGYFHFNWGWTGMCNGYYLLNALNPTQQGTGGYYGGYNSSQAIITGFQPTERPAVPNLEKTLTLEGSVTATAVSNILTFSFVGGNPTALANENTTTFNPKFGIEITKADGSGEPTYVAWSSPTESQFGTFQPGNYMRAGSLVGRARFDSSLPDGKYMVRIVCQNVGSGGDGQWHHLKIAPQNFDYIYVTKAAGNCSVENLTALSFNLKNAEITSPLYYNNPFLITLSIENPNDIEITQGVIPYLYKNGKEQYSGESRLVTLMPKETTTLTYSCTFQQLQGGAVPSTSNPVDFDFILIDSNTGKQYGNYGTVTMKRSANNATLRGKGLAITNAEEEGMNDQVGYLYGLNNFSDINVSLTVEAINGFVASPLTAIITEYDPESRTPGPQVYEKDFDNMVYLAPGESENVSTTLHLPNFDVSKMYSLGIYYQKNTTRAQLATLRFAASSGVEGVTADNVDIELQYAGGIAIAASPAGIRMIEAYDAKGARIGVSADRLDLTSAAPGLYILRAVDNEGNSRVIKVAK